MEHPGKYAHRVIEQLFQYKVPGRIISVFLEVVKKNFRAIRPHTKKDKLIEKIEVVDLRLVPKYLIAFDIAIP